MKENDKIDPHVIADVISLLLNSSDEGDHANRVIAYSILCSLEWNFDSITHEMYAKMVWFGCSVSFAEENNVHFSIEKEFSKKVIRKFKLYPVFTNSNYSQQHLNISDLIRVKLFTKRYIPTSTKLILRNLREWL